MSLPNYSPHGTIRMGCVPWNNSYNDVRYYSDLEEQLSNIASLCTIATDDYVYIGKDGVIKVPIEADKLYHCNYMMYQNTSITNRWIYCFITNVEYINDHTSAIAIETDIFQTYLYGVDWTLPPCFIDRATTATESDRFMVTQEPSFPLLYNVSEQTSKQFKAGGAVVVTGDRPVLSEVAGGLLDALLNPDGYVALQSTPHLLYGVPQGCDYIFFEYQDSPTAQQPSAEMYQFLKHMNECGAIDSIISIFSVPDFFVESKRQVDGGRVKASTYQFNNPDATATIECPPQGDSLNGYVPKNKKLLYYPYNYLHVIDNQGSVCDLRYELFNHRGAPTLDMKYAVSPACQVFVYPYQYRGLAWDYESGFTTACGALGTWGSDTFATWWAQNSGTIAIAAVSAAATMIPTSVPVGLAAAAISGAAETFHMGMNDYEEKYGRTWKGYGTPMYSPGVRSQMSTAREMFPSDGASARLAGAGAIAGGAAAASQIYSASKAPDMVHGSPNFSHDWAIGTQGIYAQRISLVPEYAQQIDMFFDKYGYSVSRIERFSLESSFWSAHPYWGYIKTIGATAKSENVKASETIPTDAGNGVPASALALINARFDSGMTWWNTTSGFGDYSLNNHA